MKEILKNKFLLILSILLFFITIFSSNVFASSDNIEITGFNSYFNEDCTYTIPKDVYNEFIGKYDYSFIYINSYFASDREYNSLSCLTTDHQIYMMNNSDAIYVKGNYILSNLYFNRDGNRFIYDYSSKSSFFSEDYTSTFIGLPSGGVSSFAFVSRDILKGNPVIGDVTDEVLFQGALPGVPQVEPLKEIQQPEEILPAILKIVKMILPACLIIFGTLLVLYLIKSKNLLQL